MDELKPCPFCGEAERLQLIDNGEYGSYIVCIACSTGGPFPNETKDGAKKIWNKRPVEDDLRRQLEEARAALVFAQVDGITASMDLKHLPDDETITIGYWPAPGPFGFSALVRVEVRHFRMLKAALNKLQGGNQ
jgi:hypothetical protein